VTEEILNSESAGTMNKTMNAMTRWNPWKEMEEAQRHLSSVFNLTPFRRGAIVQDDEAMTLPEWAPAADVVEDEKEYLIKVELPEVRKEDVKVTLENGTLTIAGERKSEKEVNNRKVHRVERSYGRFVRSFLIPDDADASAVNAAFKDGVLSVHLTKSEKAQPKQIEVKAG
jgi:HSP20 family protein